VDNELEVIHHQMEETRASLADKLDTLETHVLGTVHEATDAVAHTVEDVKSVVDTVTSDIQETVDSVTESVKHTFDISDHVRRHPWGMFCGAMTAGFIGGRLIGSSRVDGTSRAEREEPPRPSTPIAPTPPQAASPQASSGLPAGVSQLLDNLKGLAVGTLMGVVRDLLSGAVPESLKPDVMKAVDDMTVQLGGKLLDETSEPASTSEQPASPTGEQPHDEQKQDRGNGSKQPAGGKKGQQPGGRFDRRNPPRR